MMRELCFGFGDCRHALPALPRCSWPYLLLTGKNNYFLLTFSSLLVVNFFFSYQIYFCFHFTTGEVRPSQDFFYHCGALARASAFRVGLGVGWAVIAPGLRACPSRSCDGWVCGMGAVGASLVFGLPSCLDRVVAHHTCGFLVY